MLNNYLNPNAYFHKEINTANSLAQQKGIDVDSFTEHQQLAALFAFNWQSDLNDYERTEFLNSCPFTNRDSYEYRVYSTVCTSRTGVTFTDHSVSVLINNSHDNQATQDLTIHVYKVLCELSYNELQALCFG